MSMWMHINWDKEKIESWKKTRLAGKRDYVRRESTKLVLPMLIGYLVMAYIIGNAKDRFDDPGFWLWLISYIFIAIVAIFGGASWKWNETEASYQEHLKKPD